MRVEELKKSLNDLTPLCLISGEDAFFRELAIKTIKKAYLTAAPELNYSVLDGSQVKNDPDGLVGALLQYPFMSEKRVVVVREYYPTAAELKNKSLAAYFAAPSETGLLAIVNQNPCENLKKLPYMTFIDCSKADIEVAVRYVQVTLKRENLIITAKTARLLCEYCGGDMTRISGETQKLASYCYGNAEVTEEDVTTMVVRDTDYRIYEMTEKIANGKKAEAYEIMNDMLEKSTEPQLLFTSVYYHFRRLFFCAVSALTPAALSQKLGIKEFAVKKSIEQSKKFSPKKLKNVVCKFAEYDAAFKSGEISIDAALFLAVGGIMND